MKINEKIIDLFKCNKCGSKSLIKQKSKIYCNNCGVGQNIWNEMIIQNTELDNIGDDKSAYEAKTKHKYQSSDYAKGYLNEYKFWYNPRYFYKAWIAYRERKVISYFLSIVNHDTSLLLDLPAGSGKLASVHKNYNYQVLPADVSFEMLKVGFKEWDDNKNLLGMVQIDATNTNLIDDSIDSTVCLRLLHRLNANLVQDILNEFKRITKKYMIISYSISDFNLRNLIKGNINSERMQISKREWENYLSNFGNVEKSEFVCRGVSSEVISLINIRN